MQLLWGLSFSANEIRRCKWKRRQNYTKNAVWCLFSSFTHTVTYTLTHMHTSVRAHARVHTPPHNHNHTHTFVSITRLQIKSHNLTQPRITTMKMTITTDRITVIPEQTLSALWPGTRQIRPDGQAGWSRDSDNCSHRCSWES